MQEKFLEYLRIQQGGLTNMFDVASVIQLSHGILSKDDCLDIMANYETYQEQYE